MLIPGINSGEKPVNISDYMNCVKFMQYSITHLGILCFYIRKDRPYKYCENKMLGNKDGLQCLCKRSCLLEGSFTGQNLYSSTIYSFWHWDYHFIL